MKGYYLMNQSLLKDKEERRLLNKKMPYNILNDYIEYAEII